MAIKFADKGSEDEGKPKKAAAQAQADRKAAKDTVGHTEPAPDLPFGRPGPKSRGRRCGRVAASPSAFADPNAWLRGSTAPLQARTISTVLAAVPAGSCRSVSEDREIRIVQVKVRRELRELDLCG